MTYLKKWHRDYAAESIKRYESDGKGPRQWVEYAVECGQVAELAKAIGDEKAASIADTVIATIAAAAAGGNARSRSRRTITPAQRWALATVLLERFETPRGIAGEVWQLTDVEINEADA